MLKSCDGWEVWKPIPGYGNHEASSEGRLRNRRTLQILRTYWNTDNYDHGQQVIRADDGRRRTTSIHHLVALAFHGPCPDGREAGHLDGNTRNNLPGNIAWVTKLENARQCVQHGHSIRGTRHPRAHLTLARVQEIRQLYAGGLSLVAIGLRLGLNRNHVASVALRRSWAWA